MDCSACDSNAEPLNGDCVKEANSRNVDVREESCDKIVTSQCVNISSADNSSDSGITSIACSVPIENAVTIIGDQNDEKYVKTHNKENHASKDGVVESGDAHYHSSIANVGKVQNAISSVETEQKASISDDSLKSKLNETGIFQSSEANKSTNLRSKDVKLLTNQAKVLPCSSSLNSLTNCESNIILQSSRKMVKMAHVVNENIEESQDVVLSPSKREVSDVTDNVNKVDSTQRSKKDPVPSSSCSLVQNVKKSQENIFDGNSVLRNSSSRNTDLSENLTLEPSLAKQVSENILGNSSSASKCMGPEIVKTGENLGNLINHEDNGNLSDALEEKQSETVDIKNCKIKESLNSASFPGSTVSELVNVGVSGHSKVNLAEKEKFISSEVKETSTYSTKLEILSESTVDIKLESVSTDTVKFESENVNDSSILQGEENNDALCSRSVSDSNIQSNSVLTSKFQKTSNSALNFDSVDYSTISVPGDNGSKNDQSHNEISGEYQVPLSSTVSASTNSQVLSEVSSVNEEMKHTLRSESEGSGINAFTFHSENGDNNILCIENVSKEVPNTSSTPLVNVNSDVSEEVDCIGAQDSCEVSSLTNENIDKSCSLENLSKLKSPTSGRSLIISEMVLQSVSKEKEITLHCEGNSENNVLTHDSSTELPNIGSSKKSVQHEEESNPVTRRCSNQKTSLTEGDPAKLSDVSPTKSGASLRSVLLSEIALKSVSDSEGIGTLPFKMDNSNPELTSPKKSPIIGRGFPRIVLREKLNKSKKGKKPSCIKKTVGDKTSTESTERVLDSKENEIVSEHASGNHCSVMETSISENTIDCTETNISSKTRNFFLKNVEICLIKVKESVLTKYGINLKDISSDDVKKNIDECARKSPPSLPVELKENSDVDLKQKRNKRKRTQSCEEEKNTIEYKPKTKKAKISRTSQKQFSSGYRKKLPLKKVSRSKFTKNCVAMNIDKGKKVLNVTKNVSKTHIEEKRNMSDVSNEKNMASKCNELNIKRLQIHVTKLDQNFLSKYGIHLNKLKMTVAGGPSEGLGKVANEGKRKERMKTVKEPKKEEKKTTMNVVGSKHRRFSRNTSLLKDSPKETVPLVSNESSENVNIKQRYKQSRKKVKRVVKNVAEIKDRKLERNILHVKKSSKKTVLHVDNKETENIVFKLADEDSISGTVVNNSSSVKENRSMDLSNCTVSETVHCNTSEQKGTVISSNGEGGTVQRSGNKLRSVRRKARKNLTEQNGKCNDSMDLYQNNADAMLGMREDSLKTFENLSSEKCVEGNTGFLQDDTRNTAVVKDVSLKSFDISLKSSKKTSDSKESLDLESSSILSAPLLQEVDCDVGVKVSDECPTKEIALPKDSAFNLKVAVICLSKIDNNELLKHGISVDLFPKRNENSVSSKEVHENKEGIVPLKSILSRRSEQLSSSEASSETRKRKRNVSFSVDKYVRERSESPPEKMFKPNLT